MTVPINYLLFGIIITLKTNVDKFIIINKSYSVSESSRFVKLRCKY